MQRSDYFSAIRRLQNTAFERHANTVVVFSSIRDTFSRSYAPITSGAIEAPPSSISEMSVLQVERRGSDDVAWMSFPRQCRIVR